MWREKKAGERENSASRSFSELTPRLLYGVGLERLLGSADAAEAQRRTVIPNRRRDRSVRLASLVVFLFCSLSVSAATIQSVLKPVRPAKIGVDRAGHLWAWDVKASVIHTISPAGKKKSIGVEEKTSAADADSAWGVASLSPDGDTLVVVDWSGKTLFQTPLRGAGSAVCWIDDQRVAVASRFGPIEVEVWNVGTKRVERQFPAARLVDAASPGAQFARAMLLQYAPSSRELIALDAYYGDYRRYSLETGEVLGRGQIRHPGRAATDEWLRGLDQQHKRDGASFRPLMWSYPTLALAPDGTAWIAEGSTATAVNLVGIRRDGTIVKKSVESPCPSVRIELWRERFVFYRDPGSPKPYCIDERRMK